MFQEDKRLATPEVAVVLPHCLVVEQLLVTVPKQSPLPPIICQAGSLYNRSGEELSARHRSDADFEVNTLNMQHFLTNKSFFSF